ncbi:mucin-17-like isoform X1 [Neodiprion virginianus]|uniref:mucin-17-like isoform X1 n=1 Tax=Neodiprion virginianus TaxID=2961670 RepID=UPI001EE707D4|nr:mucin-17-like isoform X1 [Neodiprion virginianus]
MLREKKSGIVRRRLVLALAIVLILEVCFGSAKGERWSRQVANSEWIPLASPRSIQESGSGPSGDGNPGNLRQIALPAELQQQYQQQLLQIQETQESIQKLLLLQQQLRAQQQLLQAQSYLPEGFATDEERKSALHQSTFANVQTLPQLAPDALLPPPPGNQPQPPEFPAQNFLAANNQKGSTQSEQDAQNQDEEQNHSGAKGKTREYAARQGGHYRNSKQQQQEQQQQQQQIRDDQNSDEFNSQTAPSSLNGQNDGEEEVQLVYVPAETLTQQKTQRGRNRKQQVLEQQQQSSVLQQTQYQQPQRGRLTGHNSGLLGVSQGIEGTRPTTSQQVFAQQILYQLQQDQLERDRIQKEAREKELARLKEEQKELERQAKLHEERVQREQEAKRQKELELRKELERQAEEARQKELEKLKKEVARREEIRRQEELERKKVAEIRAQERRRKETLARQAEIDKLAALERQKEIEIQRSLEQQRELERQQAEDEARARAQLEAHRQAHQETIEQQRRAQDEAASIDAQNRARNQAQQQHLTETVRPKNQGPRTKGRQRHGGRQEAATTPSPNQPPLSVYMGSTSPVKNPEDLRVSDVLSILKDAKTISVLDSVGPDAPQVFVGPTNLDPPPGYAKFDLPYLSAIDNNRVERKVDKLPFFVAPLSFKPPPGYSKIPFPAPHIGSVVVNTLEDEPGVLDGVEETAPIVEPNAYATTPSLPYAPQSTPEFSQEALIATTTPSYQSGFSSTPFPGGTRYRHRQFYNDDRSPQTSSTPQYHPSTETIVTKTKFRQFYVEEQGHGTAGYNSETTPSTLQHNQFQEEVGQAYKPVVNEQPAVQETAEIAGLSQGPTQYSIPNELPRISQQLPSLVNSLYERNQFVEKTTHEAPTTPPTTTTTTTEPSTTTHRNRGRQRGRIVPTRPPTTTEYPSTRSSVTERSRLRPYSRSRVRQGYVTTTEAYQEPTYEPTKAKLPETREKTRHFNAAEQHRKPVERNHLRYRGRGGDRNAVQPEAHPDAMISQQEQNAQNQEPNHPNIPPRHSLQGSTAPIQNPEEVFQSSPSPTSISNDGLQAEAQPLHGGSVPEAVVGTDGGAQVFQQQVQGIQDDHHAGFPSVEASSLNGFNFQPQIGAVGPTAEYPQTTAQLYDNQPANSQGKDTTNSFQYNDFNRDQVYGSAPVPNHQLSPPDSIQSEQHLDAQGPTSGPVYNRPSDDSNGFTTTSTTTEAPEVTTPRPTSTSTPSIIRQRVRTRLGQNGNRPRVDSAIQTRPTGSRDEFVRFSAVNQDRQLSSSRTQPGSRTRSRNRSQANQRGQTANNDYVRIQAPPQRPTTTTTTTQAPKSYDKDSDEEIEYGFIRPPSFKPIHPISDENNENVGTYRPKHDQVQSHEVQSSNDSPVEVSSPHSETLKNRSRYQIMNRRPLTRSTTESPRVANVASQGLEEEAYTVKPRVHNDQESRTIRPRNRGRRPAKKRTTTTSTTTTTTTTTTEPVLDSSNELPLDENYPPQIIQGIPASPEETDLRTLFKEELNTPNLESLPQAEALQRPVQLSAFQQNENLQFPRSDFVLNFGIGSSHEEPREEYDQTQLASSTHRKYTQLNRGTFDLAGHLGRKPASDIDGAESQWSTKLTLSSFQPSSLANHVQSGSAKDIQRQEKSDDSSFDIITAGPDLLSDKTGGSEPPISIVVNASYLGNAKKEGLELKERGNRGSLHGRQFVEQINDPLKDSPSSLNALQFWNNGQGSETVPEKAEATMNETKTDLTTTPKVTQDPVVVTTEVPTTLATKDGEDETGQRESATSEHPEEPTTTKRTTQRRRRVRVRVRPSDDFVSAESQHVASAWNTLFREKQSHEETERFDKSKTPTTVSSTTSEPSTTVKSFLEEFFEEMTKNSDEEPAVEAVMTTMTSVPDDLEKTSSTTVATTTTETPTTQWTTTQSQKTSNLPTTMQNEKFVTEETTERQNVSPKSEERLTKLRESVIKEDHRFHSKHRAKPWWKHDYETVTEEAEEEKFVTVDPKLQYTVAEDPEDDEVKETTLAHSISGYVDAFFKTMEGAEEPTTPALASEETSTVDSTPVFSDRKSNASVETRAEKTEAEDAATTTMTKVDQTTTPGQVTTVNFTPNTTPEVPISPDELTTEVPVATTTAATSSTKDDQLGKVLRTSTTTEVSHMTEICYRGRCVKTKSVKRR